MDNSEMMALFMKSTTTVARIVAPPDVLPYKHSPLLGYSAYRAYADRYLFDTEGHYNPPAAHLASLFPPPRTPEEIERDRLEQEYKARSANV